MNYNKKVYDTVIGIMPCNANKTAVFGVICNKEFERHILHALESGIDVDSKYMLELLNRFSERIKDERALKKSNPYSEYLYANMNLRSISYCIKKIEEKRGELGY